MPEVTSPPLGGTSSIGRGDASHPRTAEVRSQRALAVAGETRTVGTHRRDLPKGRSWPLRIAQIEELLIERGAPHPSRISRFPGPRTAPTKVSLLWYPTGRAQPWQGGDEYVSVVYTSVPSEHRAQAARELLAEVIPELADWLLGASQAPEGWLILPHDRVRTWEVGGVSASGDTPP